MSAGTLTARPATVPTGSRLLGMDAARGIAVLGMMAVHSLYDQNDDGSATVSYLIAGGRAAAMFAVLAGVGIAFTTGRKRVRFGPDGRRAAVSLLTRGLVVGLIGLALGWTDGEIAGVILPYYAVLFVLAIPLVFLPTRALLARDAGGGGGARAEPARASRPADPRARQPQLRLPRHRPARAAHRAHDHRRLPGAAVGGVHVRRHRAGPHEPLLGPRRSLAAGRRCRSRGRRDRGLVVAARPARRLPADRRRHLARRPRDRAVDRRFRHRVPRGHHPDHYVVVAGHRRSALQHPARPGPDDRLLAGRPGGHAAARPRHATGGGAGDRCGDAPDRGGGRPDADRLHPARDLPELPLDVFGATSGYVLQVVVALLFASGWRLAVGRGPLESLVRVLARGAGNAAQR